MIVEDVYGVRRQGEVMESTWGHLRPVGGRHDGYLIAACSAYDSGERSLIAAAFGDVPDSPWLYQAMYDLINDAEMDEGRVYRFAGSVVTVDDRLRFEGEWRQVDTEGGDRG